MLKDATSRLNTAGRMDSPIACPLWPRNSFAAKWHTESDEYKATPLRSPVEIPAEAADRLAGLAARAFRLLQCLEECAHRITRSRAPRATLRS